MSDILIKKRRLQCCECLQDIDYDESSVDSDTIAKFIVDHSKLHNSSVEFYSFEVDDD